MDVTQVRLGNIRLLMERRSDQIEPAPGVAGSAGTLLQVRNAKKKISDAGARVIERLVGLPPGWLDQPRTSAGEMTDLSPTWWEELPADTRTVVLQFAATTRQLLSDDEMRLLQAFRAATPAGREVILGVASSQMGARTGSFGYYVSSL